MSGWKRGPYPVESRGGGGKWASHRNYSRRLSTHEDYEDDDKRRSHHYYHRSTGSGYIGGGIGGAVKRPGSRHGRRRERSYDHRHRRRSSSSSRRRDSHRPHRQQEKCQQGDDELHGTGRRRRRYEEDYSKSSPATEVERRQKQLLSALDRQLATYQSRFRGEGDDNKDSNSKKGYQEGQEEGCSGSGRTSLPSSRVVLYGVDLGVQQCHLNSMLEQLVGRRPLSVFRPAAALRESLCDTALSGVGSLPEVPPLGFGSDRSLHLGLHDVDGAGGVVVMELPREGDTVAAAVAALNGAYVNGRIIGAVVHS